MLYLSRGAMGTGLVSGACGPSTGPVPKAPLIGYSVTDFPASQYCVYILLYTLDSIVKAKDNTLSPTYPYLQKVYTCLLKCLEKDDPSPSLVWTSRFYLVPEMCGKGHPKLPLTFLNDSFNLKCRGEGVGGDWKNLFFW